MSESLKVRRPVVDLDDFERGLFASAPAERVNDDPLAELSRIVGKTDPFKGIFAAPPAAPVVQSQNRNSSAFAPVSPAAIDIFSRKGANSAPEHKEPTLGFSAPRYAEPAPESIAQHDDPFAPRFFDEANAGPAASAQEADFFSHIAPGNEENSQPDYNEAYEAAVAPEGNKRSTRGTAVLMGVLLMAMLGGAAGIGWKSQMKQTPEGSLPVIKAATAPVKIEPAKPEVDTANMPTPAQDANAKLVSKAEQPVEIVQTPGQPPIKIARIIPLTGDQTSAIMTGTAASAQVTPPSESGLPVPRSVKTVTIDASGKPLGATATAQAKPVIAVAPAPAVTVPPTSIAQLAAQSEPVVAPVAAPRLPLMAAGGAPARTPTPSSATATDTAPVAPKATTPKATTRAAAPAPKPVVAAPKATADAPLQLSPALAAKPPKTAAKPVPVDVINAAAAEEPAAPATKTTTASGTFAVQLAAPASEAEAKTTAAKLQGQYATELNGHKTVVRKADLGAGRTVYRVRVANLSKEEAVSICESLKSSGGQCFISR